MGSNQFYLKWNNHLESLVSTFNQLLSEESMVDVTLYCEGQKLKAHKIMLSVSSPLFQNLFKENPSKNPIIILQETKYYNMKSIIDFIYKGEVRVNQDQLSGLLKTAEALKIRGLANISDDNETSVSNEINNSVNTSVNVSTKSYTKRKRRRKKSSSDSDSEQELPRKIKESETPKIVIDKNSTYSANTCHFGIDFTQITSKVEPMIKEDEADSDLDYTIIDEIEIKEEEEEKAKFVSTPIKIPTNNDRRSIKIKECSVIFDKTENVDPIQSYIETKFVTAENMEVSTEKQKEISNERQNGATNLLQIPPNNTSLSKDIVKNQPQEPLPISPSNAEIFAETDQLMEEDKQTEISNDIRLTLSPSHSSASDVFPILTNSEKLSDTEPFSASCDENSIFDKAESLFSEPSTSQMDKDSINSTNPDPDESEGKNSISIII